MSYYEGEAPPADGLGTSGFSLRFLTYADRPIGALVFIAKSNDEVQAFLKQLINVMFPLGGCSSTVLDIKTANGGSLFFETRSSEGKVTLLIRQVHSEVGSVVRSTLRECGSLPMIFGFEEGSQVVLIDPIQNNVVRASAYVDGEILDGHSQGDFSSWNEFFATVASEHPVVPARVT